MPIRTLTPDGYFRVAVFDRASGSFADVDGHILKPAATPAHSGGTFAGADGALYETSRSRRLAFEVIEGAIAEGLRELRESCCLFEAVALGMAKHLAWYERSPLIIDPTRSGPGSHAGGRFSLSANVLYGDLDDSDNLLAFLGWNQLGPFPVKGGGGTWDLRRRRGTYSFDYAWATGSTVPSKAGDVWTVGEPLVSPLMGFPFPGASLRLVAATGGTLEAIRSDGTTVAGSASGTGNVDLTLPALTFYVRVTLDAGALAAPLLSVLDPGLGRNQVYVNRCDCADATATPGEPA